MLGSSVNNKAPIRSLDRSNESAYRLTSWAFVRNPFAGSFLHLSQKRNSSVFSSAGFLPAKDDPGISSSLSKTDMLTQSVPRWYVTFFILQRLVFTFGRSLAPGRPPFVNKVYQLFKKKKAKTTKEVIGKLLCDVSNVTSELKFPLCQL